MLVEPLLLQVQPLYPRVIELTARKIEALRLEQLKLKVMAWESVKSLVKDEVNKLLSERQLCYVLKCLTNAGVVRKLHYTGNCPRDVQWMLGCAC